MTFLNHSKRGANVEGGVQHAATAAAALPKRPCTAWNATRAYGAQVLNPIFSYSPLLLASFPFSSLSSKCARLRRAIVPPCCLRAPRGAQTLPFSSLLPPSFLPPPPPLLLISYSPCQVSLRSPCSMRSHLLSLAALATVK